MDIINSSVAWWISGGQYLSLFKLTWKFVIDKFFCKSLYRMFVEFFDADLAIDISDFVINEPLESIYN